MFSTKDQRHEKNQWPVCPPSVCVVAEVTPLLRLIIANLAVLRHLLVSGIDDAGFYTPVSVELMSVSILYRTVTTITDRRHGSSLDHRQCVHILSSTGTTPSQPCLLAVDRLSHGV